MESILESILDVLFALAACYSLFIAIDRGKKIKRLKKELEEKKQ